MRQLLILAGLVLLFAGCKSEVELLYEKNEIEGSVLLTDSFAQSLTAVAPEAMVYLAKDSLADPYLYMTKADKIGKFSLPHKPTDKVKLYVVAKFTTTAGIPCEGVIDLDSLKGTLNVEVRLKPLYPGGIIKVLVTDETANKQPVSGADIYIYANNKQAATVRDATPTGFVQKLITNDQGIAFFYNLKANTYYTIGKITNASGTLYTEMDTVTVTDKTKPIDKKTDITTSLSVQASLPKSSILVSVNDRTTAEPLTGLNIYLFSSRLQAESVKDSTGATGFIQVVKTTPKGKALFQNLDGGTYYIGVNGNLSAGEKVALVVTNSVKLADNQKVSAEVPILLP